MQQRCKNKCNKVAEMGRRNLKGLGILKITFSKTYRITNACLSIDETDCKSHREWICRNRSTEIGLFYLGFLYSHLIYK